MVERSTGEEIFDRVDRDDRVIGKVLRSEAHGNPDLIHRVAHVLVFDSSGSSFCRSGESIRMCSLVSGIPP